ncbi:hypothetical protein [Streptomyces sp. bgisy154]|uniref:hypothetical protein n=1 Tax=Streptomyces sp. bgisy154 TaxID=3413794 RepID=UPI003D74A5FD
MRRNDPRLEIIAEALHSLVPGAAPAFLSVTLTETLPGTANPDGTPHTHTWTGRPESVAERVFTRLYGRPGIDRPQSPLAQAEDAKRRRDLTGELGALMSAGNALESAPWYPARPGDLVHIHYEATGDYAAFGETYVVEPIADWHGDLGLRLLHHTRTGPDAEDAVGCFAPGDTIGEPLMGPWFEAGPHRLTIVRDGRPVHTGGAR